MTATTDRRLAPALPPDPGLPGVRGLFREGGAAVIEPFLAARSWSLVESRPVQVSYRPERSCVVRYRVRARNRYGDPRVLTLCAEARHRPGRAMEPPREFGRRYGLSEPLDRDRANLVWAFPYDPSLEGLPDAAWGPVVRDRLAVAGRPLRAVAVQPLRYRPRRRAVLRYTGLHGGYRAPAPEALFGKVLRPSKRRRASSLAVRSQWRVRLAMPLEPSMYGALVFPALDGRSLRDLLLVGASLPAPERVAGLLDALPRALAGPEGPMDRKGPVRTAESTHDLLARLVPETAAPGHRVVEAVAEGSAGEAVPLRTVHGDLYEAQVFVGEGYSLGLIDLDDAGIGDPAMDAANFCAHLIALALAVPGAQARLLAYRSLVRASFLRRLGIPPAELAWREALCMLLLATGPFRVLDPRWPVEVRRRVDLAIRLLEAS
jgi:hypothetical protein